ncbi:MAG: TIGR04222 domain-containing membrane protein [Blastocatellia bacterium]
MDFLLDNPLATMDGSIFLVFFAFFIFFCLIILAIFKSQADKTDKLGVPAIPPEIDPYEIAYLRGSFNEMTRSVVFSLVQKGLIEVLMDDKTGKVRRVENSQSDAKLTSMEQLALNWIGTERDAKDVFVSKFGLVEQLEQQGMAYHNNLERRQMLTTYELENQVKSWGWATALIITGLGAYKVFAAILFGNFNFVFTIILTVIGVGIALRIGRLPRITKLGKVYLERLQFAFENLKYTSQAPYIKTDEQRVLPQNSFASVDPLLLSVGVFGTGILAGTMFNDYNQAFARVQQQQAGSSSGCGSACGSSCSSGDGGGSSCGGGCGGGCS